MNAEEQKTAQEVITQWILTHNPAIFKWKHILRPSKVKSMDSSFNNELAAVEVTHVPTGFKGRWDTDSNPGADPLEQKKIAARDLAQKLMQLPSMNSGAAPA